MRSDELAMRRAENDLTMIQSNGFHVSVTWLGPVEKAIMFLSMFPDATVKTYSKFTVNS